MDDATGKVRQRAYDLWIEAGQPDGRHEDHWAQALRDLGFDHGEDGRPDPGSTEPSTPGDPTEARPGGDAGGSGSAA